jgi:nucleoside-diphosphate-sugar epimerase/uncharacterized membrane protein
MARETQSRRPAAKPVVLITGVAGNVGTAIAAGLEDKYRVVGLDVKDAKGVDIIKTDLTSSESIRDSLSKVRERHDGRIASVIHLAAYFDFTGEEHPLYEKLNVEGTRKLLLGLSGFTVEQFVYAGTMLVHRPTKPGRRLDESAPIEPKWAYPKSKAAAEEVIRAEHGEMPIVLLHLAGLYDEETAVPTLAQQIARIYERDFKSHLYSGDTDAGQAVVHAKDMVEVFRRTVDRRKSLPPETVILAGEPDAMSYAELQEELGRLIHGEAEWQTLEIPETVAKAAAWLEEASEPIVPDALDRGEKPFIRPFMVEMASDHYALDISRAKALLGWTPKHSLRKTLPRIVGKLKKDPAGWYRKNGITPPDWLEAAEEEAEDPEALRERHDERYRAAHFANLWGPWFNLALASWLVTSPPLLGYSEPGMIWSDILSGLAIAVLAFLSMSPRFAVARFAIAVVGFWLLFAPLVFWTANAAAYLNDTLAGALAIGFSLLTRPVPGVSIVAAETGPTIPPGWDYSPSSWTQRLPVIILAFIGLYVSRYLAAYQLGQIETVWEPFFAGSAADPQNGTEEIITSSVSRAWPLPDAGIGAVTYMLEILTGIIGTSQRWRTMPWLVVLFGVMIVPLGAVSIAFIIIQPIVIGTWCTLCLIAAAAMLVQIPYSLDELVATGQFLRRRQRAGRPLLRIFFTGDTDDGPDRPDDEHFDRSPIKTARDMVRGGMTLPWNLAASAVIGIALMFTRLIVGAEGAMADADHLLGALIATVAVTSLAEVARAVRFLNVPLAGALILAPFVFGASLGSLFFSVTAGVAVILLSFRRGPIRSRYGDWDKAIL